MPINAIASGSEVAILPRRDSPPADVLEIATVSRVSQVYIQLMDGRMFATIGARGLNTGGYLAPATDEHRAALLRHHSEPAA